MIFPFFILTSSGSVSISKASRYFSLMVLTGDSPSLRYLSFSDGTIMMAFWMIDSDLHSLTGLIIALSSSGMAPWRDSDSSANS